MNKKAMRSKLFFICFLLLLICPITKAQLSSLRIEGKPEKSSDEIVGVRDDNGRFCAAIQVISDMDGFKYDSYNGVIKVDDNPGKDMVYLTPDERVLEILKSGYEPLKLILSEIGIQLQSKDVWKMKITGEKKLIQIPINIITEPDGANIYIDDKLQGSGQSFKASDGKHTLRIEKEGFRAITEEITVSESLTLFKYRLKEIEQQKVTIKSTPTDVLFFINDIEAGKTDKQIFRFPGKYRLKLVKSKYETIDTTIAVKDGSVNNFSFSLIKSTAKLTIITTPSNAEIFLNGEMKSSNIIELSPGKHKIDVQKDGYFPETRTVTVDKGKDISESFSLMQKTGKLQVVVEPMEAQSILKQGGKEIDRWTGSKIIDNLPVGDYSMTSSSAGYETQEKKFSIELDKTTNLDIRLEKGGNKPVAEANDFVFVEGGTFQMGENFSDEDEKPVHSVTVGSFYISKYEVTQKEYQNVMGENPSNFKGENNPVEKVSWFDAIRYCNKRSEREGRTPCYTISGNIVTCNFSANGYRLPTEAEWEYAARGGNKSRDYKYSGSNNIANVAWYNENSGSKTHPVGQKAPNELGLYDMSGNVWEWCWDWYDGNYYSSSVNTNPKGLDKGDYKILRGGSWYSLVRNCRAANRYRNEPESRYYYYGFRLFVSSLSKK